jgi:hypothetical protein
VPHASPRPFGYFCSIPVFGKSYGFGELELVSLGDLRERVKSAGTATGRLKVTVVTGDVQSMHQYPENLGALFQVATQFNLGKAWQRLLEEARDESHVSAYRR